jgi:hypothetical protein
MTNITYKNTKEISKLLPEIIDLVYERLAKDSNITSLFLLILGILNRTHELTESAIWSIDNSRPITAITTLRSLHETLGYIFYQREQIQKIKDTKKISEFITNSLLGSRKKNDPYQQINILTCIDCATKRFPKLRKIYNDSSEAVHPNSASHFYVGKADKKNFGIAQVQLPFYDFKNNDKLAITNQVGECVSHIISISRELIQIA